mmetsp:Transcript_6709/g.17161  ORF Transcript_6709/g.17161 Transcript_6709/m.17161 type:complete len:368 (-) Transcript_6709:847-1950(-)
MGGPTSSYSRSRRPALKLTALGSIGWLMCWSSRAASGISCSTSAGKPCKGALVRLTMRVQPASMASCACACASVASVISAVVTLKARTTRGISVSSCTVAPLGCARSRTSLVNTPTTRDAQGAEAMIDPRPRRCATATEPMTIDVERAAMSTPHYFSTPRAVWAGPTPLESAHVKRPKRPMQQLREQDTEGEHVCGGLGRCGPRCLLRGRVEKGPHAERLDERPGVLCAGLGGRASHHTACLRRGCEHANSHPSERAAFTRGRSRHLAPLRQPKVAEFHARRLRVSGALEEAVRRRDVAMDVTRGMHVRKCEGKLLNDRAHLRVGPRTLCAQQLGAQRVARHELHHQVKHDALPTRLGAVLVLQPSG